jgi:hypothetical protein
MEANLLHALRVQHLYASLHHDKTAQQKMDRDMTEP